MKDTFASRLETASARVHAAGRKAMQHPITTILSLCMLAGMAATIVTYSQDADKTPINTTAATLPAEREITDSAGRKLKVTILSQNAGSVKIRRAVDGVEFTLPLDKLSATDREWLNPQPKAIAKPAPYDFDIVLVEHNWARQQIKKGDTIDGVREEKEFIVIEVQGKQIIVANGSGYTPTATQDSIFFAKIANPTKLKLMQSRDPLAQNSIKEIESRYVRDLRNFSYQTTPPMEIIDQIVPKATGTEETVSLRPQFEKAGVVPKKQIGNTCALYAMHHLCEYYKRIGKLPNYNFGTLQAQAITHKDALHKRLGKSLDRTTYEYSIKTLLQLLGERNPGLIKRSIDAPGYQEFMKHEIRSGRPVIVSGELKNQSHAQVLVGFKTKDQTKIEWEVLDSNIGYTWTNQNLDSAVSIAFH